MEKNPPRVGFLRLARGKCNAGRSGKQEQLPRFGCARFPHSRGTLRNKFNGAPDKLYTYIQNSNNNHDTIKRSIYVIRDSRVHIVHA